MRVKSWIAVLLRAALLGCCWIGVHRGVLPPEGGFMSSEKLLYFTYQSNLWVLVITAAYLALGVVRLIKGGVKIPRALQIARYAVAVSITMTFLIFWTMLSSVFRTEYLLSLKNQTLHTVAPLLYIADFLLFDRGKPMTRHGALWAAALPLYYFGFSFAYAAANPAHVFKISASRYPYFFLDVDKYGWLGSEAGMGVLWWALLLTCATLLLGYAYRFIQLKTIRQVPEKGSEIR
jgi:hypothetical protein